MQSSPQKQTETNTFELPVDILLSLATAPFLVGLLGVQAVSPWLKAAGLASEELFRGDRLPVLHFPTSLGELED